MPYESFRHGDHYVTQSVAAVHIEGEMRREKYAGTIPGMVKTR